MKYFLAHNEIDVFHYGELTEGQVVETGQPHLEFFEELTELENRLFSFGVIYQNNDITDITNSLFDEILDSTEPI